MRFAPLAVLLLLITSPSAFAQFEWGKARPPRSGACFFRDADFRGDSFCLKDGERWASLPRGFNDSISSIRVFGGARLRIFYDVNFQGPSLLVNRNVPNLRNVPIQSNPRDRARGNWNDRVSAIAVFRERDEWEPQRDQRDRRN